jgi:hypothetical protein
VLKICKADHLSFAPVDTPLSPRVQKGSEHCRSLKEDDKVVGDELARRRCMLVRLPHRNNGASLLSHREDSSKNVLTRQRALVVNWPVDFDMGGTIDAYLLLYPRATVNAPKIRQVFGREAMVNKPCRLGPRWLDWRGRRGGGTKPIALKALPLPMMLIGGEVLLHAVTMEASMKLGGLAEKERFRKGQLRDF